MTDLAKFREIFCEDVARFHGILTYISMEVVKSYGVAPGRRASSHKSRRIGEAKIVRVAYHTCSSLSVRARSQTACIWESMDPQAH